MKSKYPKLNATFAGDPDDFPVQLAARHEPVLRELDAAWGSEDCARLLGELVFSDRPDRLGFTYDVMMELFALRNHHDAFFPQFATGRFDSFVADASLPAKGNETPRAPSVASSELSVADYAPADAKEVLVASEAPSPVVECDTWPELTSLDELHAIHKQRVVGARVPVRDSRKLLEILKSYADVTDADIAEAIRLQTDNIHGKKREPIGKVLLRMSIVNEEAVVRALCLQYGVPIINLHRFRVEPEAMRLIRPEVANNLCAMPLAALDGVLFLAVENPFGFDQGEYLTFLTKRRIDLVMAPRDQILDKLREYGQVRTVQQGKEEFRDLAQRALGGVPGLVFESDETDDAINSISQDDASIVGLVNKIISDAAEVGASDIHIESYPGDTLAYIRFRRDGRLEEYSQYSSSYHRAAVSRIKIMSSLDISERRIAQDGKISFVHARRGRIDLRVATVPTARGIENVSIRLLQAGDPLPLEDLRMCERDLEMFRRLICRPYGLILVCGPTGSGKTTTLHSALSQLNTADRKIWTAEDPVEIVQKRICQVQVNPKIGWTFATALRAFLRADPDVIMIGEMRDQETAKIALEASMTGHVVLSTLHTNSASETTARLIDLDVDPFNLGDALIFVLAQRLTRHLCPKCVKPVKLMPTEIDDLVSEYHYSAHKCAPAQNEKQAIMDHWRSLPAQKQDGVYLHKANGCEYCDMTGYKGRVALFELMEATPEIRELVFRKSPAVEYQRVAVSQGMHTLKQDGIDKALQGLTDLSEVRGVCN